MEIIPAVDIRNGRCVQLYQGDYDRETIFSEDPEEVAKKWVDLGANRLHVVDLDGAREGEPVNIEIISKMISSTLVPVQIGGGVRSLEVAERLINIGADRVMIGTVAVKQPELVEQICSVISPESVVISVDARNGYLASDGWTNTSNLTTSNLVSRLSKLGAVRFMHTDIDRDGTLTGPNFSAIKTMLASKAKKLLVAGGISTIEHLVQLSQLDVEGAILGTSIYTGRIDFHKAISVTREYA
jgi:phosphoribosylformimino-5-aminoimidazole carboxamide ribotide isomerase